MRKIFFVNEHWSGLADSDSRMLSSLKEILLKDPSIKEVLAPELADVILIQEKGSYKDFRYIDKLLKDPIISRYTEKVYTLNSDDCATGLLRGLYTSLPKSRFDGRIHASVPYMEYPNEFIFSKNHGQNNPKYLASWRGNTKSNSIRSKMIAALQSHAEFCFETTDSWLNHQPDEKETYVDLMLNAKFSLCPAGWAAVSFRIYESMALGRCPVILADEFVPPAGPDWNAFALFYPQKKIGGLYDFLHKREYLYEQLGSQAWQAWEKFFCQTSVQSFFAQTLLTLIRTAPPTTKNIELKRWKSLNLYWSNKWTLPQRVMNKAGKWSKVLIPAS